MRGRGWYVWRVLLERKRFARSCSYDCAEAVVWRFIFHDEMGRAWRFGAMSPLSFLIFKKSWYHIQFPELIV